MWNVSVCANRDQGVTIRKAINIVIVTRCVESGFTLLYSDRVLTRPYSILDCVPPCPKPDIQGFQ